MSAPRRLPRLAENGLLLLLGIVAVLAPLIPLGPGGRLTPPDLLFCLVLAWIVRRPEGTSLLLVAALGLFADLMLSRPLGLGALGLLLAAEVVRARARQLNELPFPAEWAVAGLAFAAVLALMRLALALTLADAPGLAGLGRYLLATLVAYPLVVLGVAWCLGIRAPRATRFGDPLGRIR